MLTSHLHTIARLFLATVFLAASLAKLAEPSSLIAAVKHLLPLGVHPNTIVSISATIVAWEVLLGLLLLLPLPTRTRRHLALLAACAITILAFTGALVLLALDPNAPSCGCLGALVGVYTRHAQLQAIIGLVRNAALLWIIAWLLLAARKARAHATPSVHAD